MRHHAAAGCSRPAQAFESKEEIVSRGRKGSQTEAVRRCGTADCSQKASTHERYIVIAEMHCDTRSAPTGRWFNTHHHTVRGYFHPPFDNGKHEVNDDVLAGRGSEIGVEEGSRSADITDDCSTGPMIEAGQLTSAGTAIRTRIHDRR